MLREGLIFPSYLTVTRSIMEVLFPIQQPVSYTENNLVTWPWMWCLTERTWSRKGVPYILCLLMGTQALGGALSSANQSLADL